VPRPTIILDCDPGHDDAMAIILAARHTDLLGLTTVNGNASLGRTTANALVMTQLLGIDTPVHSGAAHPLNTAPVDAANIHGESGLDGAVLPAVTRNATSDDAVGFIIDSARTHEGLWIVAVGPLTNVALALRAWPRLASKIAGISIMGGSSTHGNTTAAAEFNIWADPEAADIVASCGAPVKMSGLNLTYTVQATPPRIDTIRAVGSPLSAIVADLLTFFSGTYTARNHSIEGAPVHDPCAVLAVTHPELCTSTMVHAVVELTGTHTRGMTLVDARPLRAATTPNIELMTSIDADRLFALLTDAVASFS
jgi:inosine-uridine nucleoside N-ribohydrolase